MIDGPNLKGLQMALFNSRSFCNKTVAVLEFLKDHNINVCFLTESWLKVDDKAKFAEVKDYGYDIISTPRRGRGGGVAFIFDPKSISLTRNTVKYSSFEVSEAILKTDCSLLRLCVIYRSTQASSQKKYQETRKALFLEQFSSYLDTLLTKSGTPIIAGDFNFHIEDNNDYWATQFTDLYHSKGFIQHVSSPTHISGGILDLVLTLDSRDAVKIDPPVVIKDTHTTSDHFFVTFAAPDVQVCRSKPLKEDHKRTE